MENVWTANRRLYLDKDGNAVEQDDPNRVELLVGIGGTLLMERARTLGLLDAPKAKNAPPETKAVTKAPANKGKKEG